jgi:uncharacterized membrane-anchored protein
MYEVVSAQANPRHANKVPQVTLLFWVIKIAATTLGETAGDAVSMTLNLGYLVSSVIFMAFFLAVVTAQVHAKTYHRFLYWLVIVATTTVGTTMADFADRSVGLGYWGGSLILFALLSTVLAVWWVGIGTLSVSYIASPKVELCYWLAILTSNTLGTALGDWLSDSATGYEGGALLFGTALLVIALLYRFTSLSRPALFWIAFILTRPLGATLGDTLTKPIADGGLNLSRIGSSALLAAFVLLGILFMPKTAGEHPEERSRLRGTA